MRRFYFLLFLFFIPFLVQAQKPIDHWESMVLADNPWHYFVGVSEPPASWKNIDFIDSLWQVGPGGFGYGDGDDATIISGTRSVYLRIKFTISNLAWIEKIVLLADYDDAYVAYINGKEVSRAGITGNPPAYDQFADSQHEAVMYQGGYPASIILNKTDLTNGENVLAIQVHNINATSSDLSSNFYLMAGINTGGSYFQPAPTWFVPPVELISSNLPIVDIQSSGGYIPDEPKVAATMRIIDNGPGSVNFLTDSANDYHGHIGIEIRGSSSQMFPKKQYAVELWTASGVDTSASLLGMPLEEDWILYAPYTDKSLIRNVLAYKLGADLGHYAPRTRYCEVFIDDLYKGVYVLTEKIKRDIHRVNISKLTPMENSGDDLTGGYIVKLDKYDGATEGLGWDSPYQALNTPSGSVIHFQYHYPKEEDITTAQAAYIQNYVTSFESALHGPMYRDKNNGYRKYIDVNSFIDFAIINEITKNVDGYRLSTFLYKDKDSKDGKLYLGPIWDFNLGFGNADYCDGGLTAGWAWDFNTICGGDIWNVPFWWSRLLHDHDFVLQLQNRWVSLRNGPFSNQAITNYIDSVSNVLEVPQQRNFKKWPILNEYIWPNNYVGNTYLNEINYLKNWISMRLAWLDTHIAGLQVLTSLDDLSQQASFMVYPNPTADGTISIHLSNTYSKPLSVRIIDQMGRSVATTVLHPGEAALKLPVGNTGVQGVCLLQIVSNGAVIVTKKIMLK